MSIMLRQDGHFFCGKIEQKASLKHAMKGILNISHIVIHRLHSFAQFSTDLFRFFIWEIHND